MTAWVHDHKISCHVPVQSVRRSHRTRILFVFHSLLRNASFSMRTPAFFSFYFFFVGRRCLFNRCRVNSAKGNCERKRNEIKEKSKTFRFKWFKCKCCLVRMSIVECTLVHQVPVGWWLRWDELASQLNADRCDAAIYLCRSWNTWQKVPFVQ